MSHVRPIRLGMVGGGEGAFIGAVHRMAAGLDGQFALVAGALSSTPEKARRSGEAIGLAPDRSYAGWAEMASAEAARPDGIEAVAIVTPNHLHAPVAAAFLRAGVHVICDKPVTTTLADALMLQTLARETRRLLAVTYTYTGYPMVRQARALVAAGRLGEMRIVQAEYAQDWLAEPVEQAGQKQAAWRTDPAQAGAGALGDIGVHATNLARYVTGLSPQSVAADVHTFVPGRRIDDDVAALIRYANGARGRLWASQVATGAGNALRLRVYGTEGALDWSHEAPEALRFTPHGGPVQTLLRGAPGLDEAAAQASRLPGGHPEGYIEAFANLYRDAARAIRAPGEAPPYTLTTIDDGVADMAFVEAVLASGSAEGAWTVVQA